MTNALSADGVVLLGDLHFGVAHEVAGIAHDVSILIDQEHVVGLDAGGSVGVAGALNL